MKKYSIFLASHDYVSPIRGGAGLLINKIAVELHERGHKVKILAPSNKNNVDGIDIINLPYISKNQSLLPEASKFIMIFIIELFKNRKKIDLIIAHGITGIPAVIFGKIFNKIVIIEATDIHAEYMKVSHKKFPGNFFISIVSKLEYFSFRCADKVIVVSNAMKDILMKNGVSKKNIHVAYLGVEANNFSIKKHKKEHLTIIHHGGIDFQDGVHYIAEAAPLILKKYPDTKFLIVGAGICLDYVKETTKRNKVEKSFTFTGWKPYQEMKDYLDQADIGLITRPDTLPNNTVPTLKLMEYWASGTPAVSARLKAIEEICEENSDVVFFEPDNYKDLADKVIFLIENPFLLDVLKNNGRTKSINTFDWNIVINKIADVIED